MLRLQTLTHVWLLQETATTCRERCGGQGYLSVNRFGQIIGFAHAGITAEGDNRVLMQKVAKEYTATASSPAVAERLAAASRPLRLSTGEIGVQAAPVAKAHKHKLAPRGKATDMTLPSRKYAFSMCS